MVNKKFHCTIRFSLRVQLIKQKTVLRNEKREERKALLRDAASANFKEQEEFMSMIRPDSWRIIAPFNDKGKKHAGGHPYPGIVRESFPPASRMGKHSKR